MKTLSNKKLIYEKPSERKWKLIFVFDYEITFWLLFTLLMLLSFIFILPFLGFETIIYPTDSNAHANWKSLFSQFVDLTMQRLTGFVLLGRRIEAYVVHILFDQIVMVEGRYYIEILWNDTSAAYRQSIFKKAKTIWKIGINITKWIRARNISERKKTVSFNCVKPNFEILRSSQFVLSL